MKSIETFREFGNYELHQLEQENPSCFNGMVRVKKIRVILEEIDEPACVIQIRIQKLWDECDNHYNWAPLEAAAKKHGFHLKGKAGTKRKGR